MDTLGVHIGDDVVVGESPGTRMEVVGSALLPATSHTAYDQSAWMTHDSLMAIVGSADYGDEFFEDYVLLDWRSDADVAGATRRLNTMTESDAAVYYTSEAELPDGVETLKSMLRLPLALAAFMALLAIATVAHALATTVRRRRADLAILRALGFTRSDTRVAVAWQATLLAAVGVVIGVPAGLLVGRWAWRQFADAFPVVYVPPLAVVAMLLVTPIAVAMANALAVGPARRAARVRPAEVLHSE
jgi:ABC-type antimicrobial peptide transport system permease subunit